MLHKGLQTFVLLSLLALASFAQNTNGRLVGTVSAPDGAIAGATVVVRDNQTGKERTVVAGDNGTFEVPQLEFGTYTVTITASGYKTFVANAVKIDVGREYPLNAQLEVGQVSEQVTVIAGAEQINASNAELSTTISNEQVRELPLNGRNPLSLISLTAGASPTSASINGQRTSATTITRDGLNVQDNFIRTGYFVSDQPTVDDISEITITTQNAGAEQGAGASFIQLVTPRGGQKFHGALYAFNRNSKFTANSFFNNASNLPRAFLNRNQFGGSLSGPVPLPGFNEGGPTFIKNKGFFFFNYEGFRLAQQATITGLNTLLPAAREGNFTFATTGGTRTVNVLTGQGFTTPITNAQGGSLAIDPIIAARYLANLPTTANGVPTGTNYTQNLSLLRSDPLIRNSFTGRFDVDFSYNHSFNAVYRRNNSADARTDIAAGFSPGTFVTQGGPTNFFSAAYRTTISANFSNELRGGFQKSEPFFNESNVPTNFIISTTGGLGLTNPEGTFRDQGRNTKYRNIQDNAVYMWGNHSFRFGGGLDLYGIQSLNAAGITPTYTIATSTNTALSTTGANGRAITATQVCGVEGCINPTDLARLINLRYFLGGIVGAGSVTANLVSPEQGYGFGPSDQRLNYEIYSAYGSDQWRVSPKLSLNFGLRYELFTPLNSPQALFLEPVIQNGDLAGSILNPNGFLDIVGTNTGKRGNFFNADKDNFAPNVSFAYSPGFENGFFGGLLGNSLVIRGGFSINYFNDEYLKSSSTLAAGNAGLGALAVNGIRPGTNSTVLAASLSPLAAFDTLPTFNTPPAFTPPPRSFAFNNLQANNGSQVFGTDPNIQVPRVYQWNIGIQREIGFKTVFEARYVGNLSNDLIRTVDFNQVDVNNNGFLQDVYRARTNLSVYDVEFARRVAECVAGGTSLTTCNTRISQAPNAQTNPNGLGPRSAAFSPILQPLGSIPLTVFPSIANPNLILTNAGVLTNIQGGAAGAIAQTIITNNLEGSVLFQPNPNIFVSEILMNAGKYNYNGLQLEVRRRFSQGLSFQANYTFSKTLTDVPGEDQNRQGEVQEFGNPGLNYGRSDNDRTHVFNANVIYELPFGKGKKFLNHGGWVNTVFGGFQVTSIVSLASGAPLSIIDPRGTESIAFQSGRQTATSTLTGAQIKDLTGIFDTPNGIYFINPSVLNATIANAATGEVRQGFDLFQTLPAGFTLSSVRAASPIGTAPFPGQVFFFNNVNGTPINGNLPRNFINGTPYINWDAGLAKNFRFTESTRLQLRAEAFNVLNRTNVNQSLDLNISSTTFGRITTTNLTPRVLQFGARFEF
ncbi:MAG TPA: TonB-dependent receptor [Pyrinomonadaceae bacterium]|jgi:hypothetical protein